MLQQYKLTRASICTAAAVTDSQTEKCDHLQQEEEVDLTSVSLGARGFSSRSLGSERMLSPQAVQACALGSEYITQPSRKVPPVEMLLHLSMLPADR